MEDPCGRVRQGSDVADQRYSAGMRFTAADTHEGVWQVASCLEVKGHESRAEVEEAVC